jgi:transcriptional regulator with XRE-family HTH domain
MPRRGPRQTLGQFLQHARQAYALSLRRAAAQIRRVTGRPLSPQYLSNLEQDRRSPSLATLQALAAGLDVPYTVLLAHAQKAEVVVRQYLQARPDCEAVIIELFLLAEQCQFAAWERVLTQIRTAHALVTMPPAEAVSATLQHPRATVLGAPEEGALCPRSLIDSPMS